MIQLKSDLSVGPVNISHKFWHWNMYQWWHINFVNNSTNIRYCLIGSARVNCQIYLQPGTNFNEIFVNIPNNSFTVRYKNTFLFRWCVVDTKLHFRMIGAWDSPVIIMTSSNGNLFRVTGHFAGNSPVTGEFPTLRPVARSFEVLFDLRLNKRLSKQSWGW